MNRNLFVCGLFLTLSLTSPAALQFREIPSGVAAVSLNGVAYGGDTFVVVGDDSTVSVGHFQTNGLQLTFAGTTVPVAATALRAASYGSGRFVIGGVNASIFYSTDGSNWFQGADAFGSSAAVRGLAFTTNSARFGAVASIVNASWSTDATSWKNGDVNNAYPLESFRGVAPTTSGFIACGVHGAIRRSTDAGANWNVIAAWGETKPDLLGIGSDGGLRGVIAGASGTIKVSTNGGASWTSATSPAGSVNNNAAAFTGIPGSEFIVVSDDGSVSLMNAADGEWTLSTNLDGVSLLGVAFAQSGLLKGVGIVAGANGRLFIAGTPPPTPASPVSRTNCAGSLPNPPLSVAIQFDATHTNGTLTVDWYSTPAGGSPLPGGTGTAIFTPPASANLPLDPNTASNYTFYAEARDLRTGLVSTNRVPVNLLINPRPTARVVSGDATICNGQSATISVDLTGIGPWTVFWSDGAISNNVVLASVTHVVSPANLLPNAATNFSFWVQQVTNSDGCIGNLPGDLIGTNTITVNPRPTARVVSGDATICNGQSATISVDLTGIGPWTVFWSDGEISNNVVLASVTHVVSPANLLPNAATNFSFWVQQVTNADGCIGNLPGDLIGTNTVTVNPRPTSDLVSFTITNCNLGTPLTLTNVLTGIGPWTIAWSSNGVSVPQTVGAGPGPYTNQFTVVPTDPLPNSAFTNLYSVLSVSNSGTICVSSNLAGDLSGQVTVIINPRPASDLLSFAITNCNLGTPLTLTNVLTGIGPWTIVWSSNGVSVPQTVGAGPGPYTNEFIVLPTNTVADSSFTNIYFVQSLSNSATHCAVIYPDSDLIGLVSVVINARPSAPTNSGNQVTCAGITNPPLSVTVASGATADWYDATGTNLVLGDSLIYTPTNTVPGSYTNLVQARLLGGDCVSVKMTQVVLTIQPCTNEISGISLRGTNAVIQWYGNFVLQSTTNLTPPVVWTNLGQGSPATVNFYTNPAVPPPENNFFRLYAPTN